MRSTSAFAVLLLEGALVAADYVKNGMIYEDGEPGIKGINARDKSAIPPSCLLAIDIDPISIGIGADPRFNWDDYCTTFLTLPATTSIKSVVKTNTVAATVGGTTTVSKYATTTLPGKPAGTVTAYCPIPTTGTNCGVRGWGYATNNVYTGNADPASCHQLCLKTPNCASFQVGDATDSSSQCNLYSVDASGNNTIAGSTSPFTFYDRDCTDLSPGCGGPKRSLAGRDSAAPKPPLWFQLLPIATQYQICGCIEGTDTMFPGSTVVSTVTSTVTKSIVVTNQAATVFTTSFATVGGGTAFVTSYTSVH